MSMMDEVANGLISDESFAAIFTSILAGVSRKIENNEITDIKPQVVILSIAPKKVKRAGLSCISGISDDGNIAKETFRKIGQSYVEQTKTAPYAVFLLADAEMQATDLDTGEKEASKCLVLSGMTIDHRHKLAVITYRRNEDDKLVLLRVDEVPEENMVSRKASNEWLGSIFDGASNSLSELVSSMLTPDMVERMASVVDSLRKQAEQEDRDEEANQSVDEMIHKTGTIKFSDN